MSNARKTAENHRRLAILTAWLAIAAAAPAVT
jgi:hypothetical protein